MISLDYGWIAFLNRQPILSSIRITQDACKKHLAEVLGIDEDTLISRGYIFKECKVITS